MISVDRGKLVAWLKKAQARTNDLSLQVQNANTKMKLAKNESLRGALKSRLSTLESDLRKAKANLHARRNELEKFDAQSEVASS